MLTIIVKRYMDQQNCLLGVSIGIIPYNRVCVRNKFQSTNGFVTLSEHDLDLKVTLFCLA